MTAKKAEVKEVIEPVEAVKVIEEVKEEVESVEVELTDQEKINEIDSKIESLNEDKLILAKKVLKEMEERVEMPLAQLNAIAHKGYEAAKKHFGKGWVE